MNKHQQIIIFVYIYLLFKAMPLYPGHIRPSVAFAVEALGVSKSEIQRAVDGQVDHGMDGVPVLKVDP